jgi:hypothetical protein
MIINGNLKFHTLGAGELQNAIMERVAGGANGESLPTGSAGRLAYNTTSNTYWYHDGSAWRVFGTGGDVTNLLTEINNIETTLGPMINSDGTFNSANMNSLTNVDGANNIYEALQDLDAAIEGKDALAELDDVNVAGVVNNQFLQYNSTSGKWEDHTLVLANVSDVTVPVATLNGFDARITEVEGDFTQINTWLGRTDEQTQPVYTSVAGPVNADHDIVEAISAIDAYVLNLSNTLAATKIYDLADVADGTAYAAQLYGLVGNGSNSFTITGVDLDTLNDVVVTSPATGHIIYRNASATWVNGAPGATSGVQPYDAGLASLAGLAASSGMIIYATAEDTYAVAAPGATSGVQPYDLDLVTFAGLDNGWSFTSPEKKFLVSSATPTTEGSRFVLEAGATVRTSMGLGDVATHDIDEFLLVDGSNAMEANLNMDGYKIVNLGTPTTGSDAVTKAYVDAMSSGVFWRDPIYYYNFLGTLDAGSTLTLNLQTDTYNYSGSEGATFATVVADAPHSIVIAEGNLTVNFTKSAGGGGTDISGSHSGAGKSVGTYTYGDVIRIHTGIENPGVAAEGIEYLGNICNGTGNYSFRSNRTIGISAPATRWMVDPTYGPLNGTNDPAIGDFTDYDRRIVELVCNGDTASYKPVWGYCPGCGTESVDRVTFSGTIAAGSYVVIGAAVGGTESTGTPFKSTVAYWFDTTGSETEPSHGADLAVKIDMVGHNGSDTARAARFISQVNSQGPTSTNCPSPLIFNGQNLLHVATAGGSTGVVELTGRHSGATDAPTATGANIAVTQPTVGSIGTPTDGVAVFCANADAPEFGTQFIYSTADEKWLAFGASATVVDGTGLSYSGNVLNVNLGAGIVASPSDEVGVDLYDPTTGAIILTTDGSTRVAGSSSSKLHLKVNTSQFNQDATNGLYIVDGGITSALIATGIAGDGITGGGGNPLALDIVAGSGLVLTGTSPNKQLDLDAIPNNNLANSTLTFAGNLGTPEPVALGETLTIGSGTGAVGGALVQVTPGTNSLTVDVREASTTLLGVASFNSTYFTVTDGAVSIIPTSVGSFTAAADAGTSTVVDAAETLSIKGADGVATGAATYITTQVVAESSTITRVDVKLNNYTTEFSTDANAWSWDLGVGGEIIGGVTRPAEGQPGDGIVVEGNANTLSIKLNASLRDIGGVKDNIDLTPAEGDVLASPDGNAFTNVPIVDLISGAVGDGVKLDDLADVDGTTNAGEVLIATGTEYKFGKIFHVHDQTTSAATWVVTHGLGQKYCNVTVVDSADDVIIPQSITFNNTTQLTIVFNTAITGRVVVMGLAVPV